MIVENQKQLTDFALEVMASTPDPRLREITTSLVKHLHAFVRDVRLSEAEFQEAARKNDGPKIAGHARNKSRRWSRRRNDHR